MRQEDVDLSDTWQILATSAKSTIRCMNCRSEHTKPGATFVNELTYPLPVSSVISLCPIYELIILETWPTKRQTP